jgi:glucose-1-phosphate thymidylyltransferase
MKGLILAAGYATRLRPLTDDVPKMLLPLAGRPMLDYLLDKLREVEEIDDFHLVTNSRFAPRFEEWAPEDVTVHDDGTTSDEERLGAIGDIRFAVERAGLEDEDVLVVAGDNLIGYSVPSYVSFWRERGGSAIALYVCPDRELIKQYGVVELDENDRVVDFEEKPAEPKSDLAATAAYLYPPEHLGLLDEYLEEGNPPDTPGNYVQWLYRRAPVYGYRFSGDWLDIGDHEQLLEADNRMRERAGLPRRAAYAPA